MDQRITALLLSSAFFAGPLVAGDLNALIPSLYGSSGNGFDGRPGIRVGSIDGTTRILVSEVLPRFGT